MITSDFLVIGSGIAGLTYALEVARSGSVLILSKKEPVEGSTRYAQGGVASVTSPLDSFNAHVEDTLRAGAGLCRDEIVRSVIEEGPARIADLIRIGAKFDRDTDSDSFCLGREGGHSQRRILHTGDATGFEIQQALYEKAASHPNIRILPYHVAVDFVIDSSTSPTQVLGVYALDVAAQRVITVAARTTMLSTGGAGKVYLYTSNPDVATGDGIAMAYRAGARVANMEFFQFHPTCLFHPKAKSFLITEALRGEGAKLISPDGRTFMQEYHPDADLAPRDVVAKAIDAEMKRSGAKYVLLDVTSKTKDFITQRFPTVYQRTLELGFDITKEPIPVVPAAHYCCGGVLSDEMGRTDLGRLYVAGESACTGLHGANRLASNSLLEAIVFAHRAAQDAIKVLPKLSVPPKVEPWDYLDTTRSSEEVLVSHSWDEVRRTMWNLVGIVRSDKRLKLAKRRIANIKQEVRDYYWHYYVSSDLVELRNIIQVAEIIIESALMRRESRGLHFNLDCPEPREDERHDTVLCRPLS